MTWTKLDDGFWSNPKVDLAGNEAAGAYVRALSYCGRHDTDGSFPESVARFIARAKVWTILVDVALIEQVEGGYLIPDYLDFNPSAREVEERRQKRADAGRLGGLKSGQVRSRGSSK